MGVCVQKKESICEQYIQDIFVLFFSKDFYSLSFVKFDLIFL